MNRKSKVTLAAALATVAYTGLLAGTASASVLAQGGIHTSAQFAGLAGTYAANGASDSVGKHDCKGQNNCKGQGGCKASENGCKGQNDCKGKGGCNTNS